jgi:hypothetical protein
MKLYSISSFKADHVYFAGQTEAKKAAREEAALTGDLYEVRWHQLLPGKAGVVALANGPGWCEAEEVICTVKPRKRKVEGNPWD